MGVDQTGAVARGGAAWRPLPTAIAVEGDSGLVHLFASERTAASFRPLSLASFSRTEVLGSLARVAVEPSRNARIRVLVDCVLGLPSVMTSQNRKPLPLRAALLQAVEYFASLEREGMPSRGRGPAEEFFARILRESGQSGIPTRLCERLAGANSVFKSRPYQKNVQTGTYRIWVELGQELLANRSFIFPHHEADRPLDLGQPKLLIEESWPSLLWKTLLGAKAREPARLDELLRELSERIQKKLVCSHRDLEICATHPDQADALVLALGGLLLPQWDGEIPIAQEGWITGLALPE